MPKLMGLEAVQAIGTIADVFRPFTKRSESACLQMEDKFSPCGQISFRFDCKFNSEAGNLLLLFATTTERELFKRGTHCWPWKNEPKQNLSLLLKQAMWMRFLN